jgi:WD40 repeat protein
MRTSPTIFKGKKLFLIQQKVGKMDGFDEEAFKQFFPSGFGKQEKQADVVAQIDRSKRTDVKPKSEDAQNEQSDLRIQDSRAAEAEDTGKDSDSDSDDDDDDDDEDEFPVSHELVLKTHERAVTTTSLDVSGGRLVSGSTDCTIKLHDFSSMTPSTIRAFKSVDPSAKKQSAAQETHPVNYVAFNPISPSQMLVIPATPQPKIYDRDGNVLIEFVKGDMYLRDMHNTKGHVSEVTSGAWSPTDYKLCATAGTDSTIRIWDVNVGRNQKEVIVHKSRAAGSAGRTKVTAVAWASPKQGGPNVLVAAGFDGSIAMWSGDGPFTRPAAEVRDAHTRDTWTGGVDISVDGRLVVTRGGDNTIKLWDTRKFKQPITTVTHQSTSDHYPTTNIKFSPTGTNIITGSDTGHLHILNPATLKPELVTPVTPGSPLVTVLWHDKLNQILTGSVNGEMHMLYNPTMSTKGAALVMSKAPKRRHVDDDPNFTTDISQGFSGDSVGVGTNGVPQSAAASWSARHPTVGLTVSGRSRDPRRPHLPAQTPFAKSQPDAKHIRESIPLSSMRDEDPREALLKYADKAKKDPIFTKAWEKTQPKTIYAEISDEEDESPEKKKARR